MSEKLALATAKVKEYIDKGPDANWTWEAMGKEVLGILGEDCKGREAEIAGYAARGFRGLYSTRKSVWESIGWGDLEYRHVVEMIAFERGFTLANRPEPPKPEPKPKKEPKAKKEKEGAEASNGDAPEAPKSKKSAPPAPPAPPAPAAAGA